MISYNKLLHSYQEEFNLKNIPYQTLKLYLFELCNKYDIDLFTNIDNEVDSALVQEFERGINRILNQEPINYVLGYTYFYGNKLKVNNNVLIPRVETEELVSYVLSCIDNHYNNQLITIADIATGSGAIAISLKKEIKSALVYASDISEKALKVAKENALDNEVNIEFMQGDMCKPLLEKNIKLDILVSNPPYIKEDEQLESSVKDFEPNIALFGGKDGLKFYRSILEDSKKIMKEKGYIFFEMGYDQKENMLELINQHYPNSEVKIIKDINLKDRMVQIKL